MFAQYNHIQHNEGRQMLAGRQMSVGIRMWAGRQMSAGTYVLWCWLGARCLAGRQMCWLGASCLVVARILGSRTRLDVGWAPESSWLVALVGSVGAGDRDRVDPRYRAWRRIRRPHPIHAAREALLAKPLGKQYGAVYKGLVHVVIVCV